MTKELLAEKVSGTTLRRTADLKVGDRITEIDTPDGPFYPVLKITAKTFVVDAGEAMGYGEIVPVRFGIRPNHAVLVEVGP